MRMLAWIGILFVCFVSGGATCARRETPLPFPPPPVVLQSAPTLEEVAAVVNRTDGISQLSSNSVTVDMQGAPKLSSSTLHIQRDKHFRLRAGISLVPGIGVDMGSNDQLFWLEVPEGVSKTLYYAHHDQYQQQLHRAVLPVDPTWIMDALGLVHIDPANVVAGPVQRQDGKLEIRSTMAMPDGVYQRVCFIEPQAGYVTDQLLYSPSGALIAQSRASSHVYYPQPQCALPHQVDLTLSPAAGPPISMHIEVGRYAVNQLLSSDPNLFVMPQSASKVVDLTTLSGAPQVVGTPPQAVAPTAYRATAPTQYPLRGTLR